MAPKVIKTILKIIKSVGRHKMGIQNRVSHFWKENIIFNKSLFSYLRKDD